MSTAPAPAINDDPRPKAKAFVDEALAQLDILLDDQDAWIANHTKEVRELVRKHQAAQEAKSARKLSFGALIKTPSRGGRAALAKPAPEAGPSRPKIEPLVLAPAPVAAPAAEPPTSHSSNVENEPAPASPVARPTPKAAPSREPTPGPSTAAAPLREARSPPPASRIAVARSPPPLKAASSGFGASRAAKQSSRALTPTVEPAPPPVPPVAEPAPRPATPPRPVAKAPIVPPSSLTALLGSEGSERSSLASEDEAAEVARALASPPQSPAVANSPARMRSPPAAHGSPPPIPSTLTRPMASGVRAIVATVEDESSLPGPSSPRSPRVNALSGRINPQPPASSRLPSPKPRQQPMTSSLFSSAAPPAPVASTSSAPSRPSLFSGPAPVQTATITKPRRSTGIHALPPSPTSAFLAKHQRTSNLGFQSLAQPRERTTMVARPAKRTSDAMGPGAATDERERQRARVDSVAPVPVKETDGPAMSRVDALRSRLTLMRSTGTGANMPPRPRTSPTPTPAPTSAAVVEPAVQPVFSPAPTIEPVAVQPIPAAVQSPVAPPPIERAPTPPPAVPAKAVAPVFTTTTPPGTPPIALVAIVPSRPSYDMVELNDTTSSATATQTVFFDATSKLSTGTTASAPGSRPVTPWGDETTQDAEDMDVDGQDEPAALTAPVASLTSSLAAGLTNAASALFKSVGAAAGVTSAAPTPAPSTLKKTVKPEIKSLELAAQAAKKELQERERRAAVKDSRDQQRRAQQTTTDGADRKRKERGEDGERSMTASASSLSLSKKAQFKPRPPQLTASASSSKLAPIEDPAAKKRKADEPSKLRQPTPAMDAAGKKRDEPAGSRPASALSQHSRTGSVASTASSIRAPTKLDAASNTVRAPPPKVVAKPQPVRAPTVVKPTPASVKKPKAVVNGRSSKLPPPVPSSQPEKYEELEDVPSEYSDSDPEEHAKKEKERPVWTHSPQMRAQLQAQSTVNPDSIFGAIPQLSLPDVLRGANTSRTRNRTSSAHWDRGDGVTRAEEDSYARRMGFAN